MPSLIDLTQYKTKSELQLADNHNRLVDALNYNFDYTINQVTSPIPATTLGSSLDVLHIKQNGSLGYINVSDLISAQRILNNNQNSVLKLNHSLAFNLQGEDGSPNAYTIFASFPGGLKGNSVTFKQINPSGHILEMHSVHQFQVLTNGGYINVNDGYFSINSLKVAGYQLPTETPTLGKILRANSQGNLEFQNLPQPLYFDSIGMKYKLEEEGPIALKSVNSWDTSANIELQHFKFGYANLLPSKSSGAFLKMREHLILTVEDLEDKSYIQMYSPFCLPPVKSMLPGANPVGSLWYDNAQENLVLVSSTGIKYINPQAIAQTVNTEEVKDFTLQPASTLSVSSGSEIKPALNIGGVGLVSTSESLKFIVAGGAVTQMSKEGIVSAIAGSTGTAKILLNAQAAINNSVNPTYTFKEAEGLGLYRSDINGMAVAVKGNPVIEFSDKKISTKGNKISNVGAPSEASDAANKQYVDARVPIGITHGAMPIVDSSTGVYIESSAKYLAGKLEIGTISEPATFKLNSSNGGSVTIKVPTIANNIVFNLPNNQLANGVLQYVDGESRWVSVDSITPNMVKADGSTALSGGLKINSNTSPNAPMISSNGIGLYAESYTEKKIGFSANGIKLLEVNATNNTLIGKSTSNNAPLIRLTNSISSYSPELGVSGTPTYSFVGDNMTGMGQSKLQSVAMIVNGNSVISASSDGINAHLNRIKGVAYPLEISDAATKQYVDSVVKPRIEISFRVTALPIGWTSGSSLMLSIYDSALIYQSASASLTYESASDKTRIIIPANFALNPDCQVYLENLRLIKMASASGVRQVAYATNRSILINYDLNIGNIVTIHLPYQ